MKTKLGEAQDALKAALDLQSPPRPVSIGWPVEGARDLDIWISATSIVTVDNALSGYAQRDERLEIDVLCLAQGTGNDYTAKRDACLTLVGKVEDALAADRTLGGVVFNAYVESISTDESVEDKRRGVGAKVHVVLEGATS